MSPASRKILYLAGLDPSLAQGHATHVRRLCQALAARGNEVILLCHPLRGPVPWRPADMRVETAAAFPFPRLRHVSSEWRLSRLLAEHLERDRPDVVLVRQGVFTLAPLLLRCGSGGAVAAHGPLQPAGPPPLVIEANSSLLDVARLGGARATRVRVAGLLQARLLRRADAVGAVSQPLAHLLTTAYALRPERVSVVPNGAWIPPAVGVEQIRSVREARGVGERTFVAGFIGTLNSGQGLSSAFGAFAALRERLGQDGARLWVIGDGPRAADRRREASALGLEVDFLGPLEEERAALYAAAAQVLLAPYEPAFETTRGDSLKILTGLAFHRPLLCGAIRGSETVEELGAGEVVRSGDSSAARLEAWTRAIERWAERWRRDGYALADWPWPAGQGPGPAFIRRCRTWEHTAAAWEAVFGSIGSARPETE